MKVAIKPEGETVSRQGKETGGKKQKSSDVTGNILHSSERF